METLKTTIHAYCFNTNKPDEHAAYTALCERLKAEGLKCFETWGGGTGHYFSVKDLDGMTVELETEHLFDNQWNTAPIPGHTDKGLRVFDWAQDYPGDFSKTLKRGHYLVQTDEMREVRRNTMACGYCGKQEPAAKGYVFCPHCLDSAYNKASDLPLTRMMAVDSKEGRAPLTEAERAYLMPLYKEAQLHGSTERGRARITRERAAIAKKYEKAIHVATTERDGFTWLMDKGINTDNVIYYNHTDRFSFGWRKPVDAELLSAILDVISEFPFNYEIKCADGRTLSN